MTHCSERYSTPDFDPGSPVSDDQRSRSKIPAKTTPYVITVGIDSSFPLPPSPLTNQKPFTSDSGSCSSGRLLGPSALPANSSSTGNFSQVADLHLRTDHQTAEWLDRHNQGHDSVTFDRLPSPMFSKESPSSSNRSSTSSSNSSGYLGSSFQVNHPCLLERQSRLSAQSSESGVSSISSSRFSYLSASGSSQSSLDRLGEPPGGHSSTVNELFQQDLKETEVLYAWLSELRLADCYSLFVQAGYDMPTISRMTPEDLTAIGITQPAIRKRLTSEISKLRIPDGIPNHQPNNMLEWLHCLRLPEYYQVLASEGYAVLDRVTDIIWEDLEEIGIHKLGHQKKIMLAIDRLKKLKQSMRRLSSADQGITAEVLDSVRFSSADYDRPIDLTPQRRMRRSMSGEDVLSTTREKGQVDVTLEKGHVDLIRDKSQVDLARISGAALSMVPAIPVQPEIVTIQVNNASRSWKGVAGRRTSFGGEDLGDEDGEDRAPVMKYESFYGNPLQDFRCLRRETEGDATPTNEKSASADRLDDVTVRLRPQLAPKPKLSYRTRRASGGYPCIQSELEESVFEGFHQWSCGLAEVKDARDDTPNGSCCLGTRSPEMSRPASAGVTFRSVPSTPARGRLSLKSAPPPPPPKRTNSMKEDSTQSSCLFSSCSSSSPPSKIETEYANELCKPPSSLLRGKPTNPSTANDISSPKRGNQSPKANDVSSPKRGNQPSTGAGSNQPTKTKPDLEHTEKALGPFVLQRKDSLPGIVTSASSRQGSLSLSGSSSPDCNAIPFANENVGTIRQRTACKPLPPSSKPIRVQTDPKGGTKDVSQVNASSEAKSSIQKPEAAAVSKKPVRPVPNQESKPVDHSRETKSSGPDSVSRAPDVEVKPEDVFNDIDDLFQGLSHELDQLLTFHG